ncbi:MAG: NAD(P)H-hydrate epimerase, partial [Clostridia bacterium]|nr:NAD(P)H-hydrate epimerase [Clostridia bacterium]
MNRATAADMRRIEALAVERGQSYEELMERAGEACAAWMLGRPDMVGGSVTIVCGRGNNGGDGFVLARHLRRVMPVTVVLAEGEPTAHPAVEAFERVMALCDRHEPNLTVLSWSQEPYLCSAAVWEAAVVVDCIYGIGFHGMLPPLLRPLMQQMNNAVGYKVAVDMPSGVSADTGEADEEAFCADHTLTFTALKQGQTVATCGQVIRLDIGIPEEWAQEVLGYRQITPEMVAGRFRPRDPDSHKGTYGRLLTVCGSYGMAGAAQLCVRGALRSGAGLVTAAVPRSVYPLLAPTLAEAVFLPLPEEAGYLSAEATTPLRTAIAGATAVVVGCGIGVGAAQTELVRQIYRYSTRPVVLDADGINAISAHILKTETVSAPLILTPH